MRAGVRMSGVVWALAGCGDDAATASTTALTAASTTGEPGSEGHAATSAGPTPTSGADEVTGDTGEPVPGLRCGGGSEEAIDAVDFDALWASFDASGLARWTTSFADPLCSEVPVDGLTSALVIRNDALAQPRSFVPGSARWVVWSNAALGCEDPLDAPLCAGMWRASFAVSQATWCGVRTGETFAHYTIDASDPLFFEVGSAGCDPTRFMLSADGPAYLGLDAAGDAPPPKPQAGEVCVVGTLPGLDASPAGMFTAQICGA